MSRVLVIGATGRLGRYLVADLLEAGHDVVAAARTPSALQGHGAAVVPLELTDRASVHALPTDVEVVVHAATARLSTPLTAEGLQQLLRTNVLGTANLLGYAVEAGVRKLIYCSSLSVYALPQALPIAETGRTYPVHRPDSFYGISKLAGELLCEQFRQSHRLACLSLRLGRIYGPGEPPEGLVGAWVQQASRGEGIVVHGNGARSLDFLYLADAVRGVRAAVERSWEGGVLNVSSGVETTWRTLAETIAKIFAPSAQPPSTVRCVPEGSRTRCVLDVSRAAAALGMTARYTLQEGLRAWRHTESPGAVRALQRASAGVP